MSELTQAQRAARLGETDRLLLRIRMLTGRTRATDNDASRRDHTRELERLKSALAESVKRNPTGGRTA